MTAYMLRAIDPELWSAVKARAQAEGHPLRWVLLRLLHAYATHAINLDRSAA